MILMKVCVQKKNRSTLVQSKVSKSLKSSETIGRTSDIFRQHNFNRQKPVLFLGKTLFSLTKNFTSFGQCH